jgi:hypothetical protein
VFTQTWLPHCSYTSTYASTSHRPRIDLASTSHRPRIDLASTSHRPRIDLRIDLASIGTSIVQHCSALFSIVQQEIDRHDSASTMAGFGGAFALRSVSWFLRFIEFCCAAIVLALYSYFLAKLSVNDLAIAGNTRGVEGVAGVALLYTILAILLVCCLGGVGFFAMIALILDLAFVGGFIYIAYETRHGANSCKGFVQTPLGDGEAYGPTAGSLPSLHTACRMNTACFAVAIVAMYVCRALLPALLPADILASSSSSPPSSSWPCGATTRGKRPLTAPAPRTAMPGAAARPPRARIASSSGSAAAMRMPSATRPLPRSLMLCRPTPLRRMGRMAWRARGISCG